ncbi:hypothetical protein JK628_02085 [Shewanella sp. KX20019]|uniref:hypothetical protein n=1 Tax=Shewanella sp. KX20019 TaxID=2803864 RepID=UPI0019263986|nr:hypothetical protein [Shewanella sp. KX20019]QQX80689.1 hypothetical protein JK628_02085 [Shewanella sp. KX20019]
MPKVMTNIKPTSLLIILFLVISPLTACSVQQTQSVAEPFITGADRSREAREEQEAHNINDQKTTNRDVEVGILTTIMAFLFSGISGD